jgi:hypothetical protein
MLYDDPCKGLHITLPLRPLPQTPLYGHEEMVLVLLFPITAVMEFPQVGYPVAGSAAHNMQNILHGNGNHNTSNQTEFSPDICNMQGLTKHAHNWVNELHATRASAPLSHLPTLARFHHRPMAGLGRHCQPVHLILSDQLCLATLDPSVLQGTS